VLINPLFDPSAYLGAAPNFIVTKSSSSITSVATLVSKAKADPGKLTYASPGILNRSQLVARRMIEDVTVRNFGLRNDAAARTIGCRNRHHEPSTKSASSGTNGRMPL
jgi:Tripartite tricarboxylate transporter family receptor